MQPCTNRTLRIGVACTLPALAGEAARLAHHLEVPLLTGQKTADIVLNLTERRLELICPGDPSLTGPVHVEFVTGAAGYRRRHGGNEMLLRAVGYKPHRPLQVFDATGGLGRDAFILASHGCSVHLAERHPVIGALLADGLRRALEHSETREAAGRITLTIGDSVLILAQLEQEGQGVDVVYLDPMFPQRTKSAKVKKELQILQLLAGQEKDSSELLTAALRAASNRVVVKRPKGAPPLTGPAPSHSHTGTTTRFDIYIRSGANR